MRWINEALAIQIPVGLLILVWVSLALGIVVAICSLFLFRNPNKDRVICVYDSLQQPKRWVRYGWHVKGIFDHVSHRACPIPSVEHTAHLNWEMPHPISGEIHIGAKAVVIVGHRLVDVDSACSDYSEFSMLKMRIGDVVVGNLTDFEDEDRLINIGRSQHDTQIQLEKWINQSISGTGWYLLRIEVELDPVTLASQN